MDHLSSPYLTAFDVPIIGSMVGMTVQLFFVYRISVLSGGTSWFVCLCICLVSRISPVATLHFPTSQFIATDTVAAFYGGVYVLSHLYIYIIGLTAVLDQCRQEVRYWPQSENQRLDRVTMSTGYLQQDHAS